MSDVARTLRHELITVEDDVEKLRAEVERLQARLSHFFDKAESIKKLLMFYADEKVDEPQDGLFADVSGPAPARADVPNKVHVRDGDVAASKAARIKAETLALLRERGSVHRAKILEHLTSLGVMGHEKSPIASLAAYLSENRDLFVTDGKGTFALRHTGHQEPSPTSNRTVGSAEAHGANAPESSTSNADTMSGEL